LPNWVQRLILCAMNNIEEVMAPISRVRHICLTIEKLHLNLIEENKTRAQYNRKGHSTNCIENLQILSLRLLLYLCCEYLETTWVPISKVSNIHILSHLIEIYIQNHAKRVWNYHDHIANITLPTTILEEVGYYLYTLWIM
jgi:hypothetical protein